MSVDQAEREANALVAQLANVRIVLVEPSHPGNIGGAARALKTMGLSSLWVVNPGRFPDPQAQWRAAGAQDVLEAVTVVDNIEAAIADAHWVVGTSARNRRIPWPMLDATQAAAEGLARLPEQRIAILFGREDSGLTNEELQRCNSHLAIPANPIYPVLNVAMAVQVVCYEFYRQASSPAPLASSGALPADWDRKPATQAAIGGLLAHLDTVMRVSAFTDPDNPGQTHTRLTRLFQRIPMDETEVAILRGVLNALCPPGDGPGNSTRK